MSYARRAIAILIGFATGFIATATVAYASLTVRDAAVAPIQLHKMPSYYNQFPGGEAAVPSTSAAGLPLWQFLAFVALGVLLAVAIVGLGYSLSHSRRSHPSPRSRQPLPH
jgi:hypothetical protein